MNEYNPTQMEPQHSTQGEQTQYSSSATPNFEYRPYQDTDTHPKEARPAVGSPYEPISIGTFLLVLLVSAIPVVNIIVMIVWAVSSQKVNLKNYAIAMLIWYAISIVLLILFWGSIVALFMMGLDY